MVSASQVPLCNGRNKDWQSEDRASAPMTSPNGCVNWDNWLLHRLIYTVRVVSNNDDAENCHLMRTCYVPGIALSFLHVFLTSIIYHISTAKETKAECRWVNLPRVMEWVSLQKLHLHPGLSAPMPVLETSVSTIVISSLKTSFIFFGQSWPNNCHSAMQICLLTHVSGRCIQRT